MARAKRLRRTIQIIASPSAILAGDRAGFGPASIKKGPLWDPFNHACFARIVLNYFFDLARLSEVEFGAEFESDGIALIELISSSSSVSGFTADSWCV